MTTKTLHDPQATTQTSEACELDFSVGGMNCASCVAHVTKVASAVPGVHDVNVNLARGKAHVVFDETRATPEQIASAITASGYPSKPESSDRGQRELEDERLQAQHAHARAWLKRFLIAAVLWFPVEVTHWMTLLTQGAHAHHEPRWINWLGFATSTLALIFVGGGFYRSAWGALKRRTSNMDTLIALGASVAYVYSTIAFIGHLAGAWRTLPNLYFMESTGLLALVSLGHWLEARARASAGSAIRELMNLTPQTALRLKRDGVMSVGVSESMRDAVSTPTPPHPDTPIPTHEEVPVFALKVGDRVLVRPGDRVPTDGVVVTGRSTIDESMITGEPLPVLRTVEDIVIGGTLNVDGRLIVRVTKVGSETALAQIVKLVETAQSSKPPVQKLADQIAAIFVPVVLGIALVTGIGWYVAGSVSGWSDAETWGRLAKAVCSVLIIACPCALGLAVPAALMVGTGRGARRGILIRDIDALQKAEHIDTVVLDKTGTITLGKPAVTKVIITGEVAEDELMQLAASAEQFSEHPLARAVVQYATRKPGMVRLFDVVQFQNNPGYGVVAEVAGRTLLVGNEALLKKYHGDETPLANIDISLGQTIVHIAEKRGNTVHRLGAILVSDQIKPDSVAAIQQLKAMGLHIVLLTGDNRAAAEAIARQVGIDDVRADVRPEEKAAVVRELQNRGASQLPVATDASPWEAASKKPHNHGLASVATRNSRVVMVGDGINDAPALAAADLGIAIGSGSDVAKETGDIVLVSGSLLGVVTAIQLSRATMKKIRQNLFFAFIYNVLAIPLAALGLLSPYIAAGAMAMSDVTVIGNALLLRRTKLK